MTAVAVAAIITGGLLIWATAIRGGEDEGFADPGSVDPSSVESVDDPPVTTTTVAGGVGATPDSTQWPADAAQTESDAERDMVHPAVGQLSFGERVDLIGSVNAGGKRWVLSEFPIATRNQMVDDGLAGPDLDPFGGEVLLVEEEVIIKAFPLIEFPPTFLETDGIMVFAGRDGDGGYPDSALIGINSLTLNSVRVVMVSTEEPTSRFYGPQWEQGSSSQLQQFQERNFLQVLSALTGTLASGQNWVVRDDPDRGLCASIADVNYGCDDESEFITTSDPIYEPRIIAVPVPPEGIDHELIGVIVYGYLPSGATQVEIRIDGQPLDFAAFVDAQLGMWVQPASVPNEPFTIAFLDEAGGLVTEWVDG